MMKIFQNFSTCVVAVASVALMSFTASSISEKITPHDHCATAVKVSWVKDSHDFGEIPQGKPVSVEFTFKNDGDEPILVADVVASCGCTASDYSKEPIAPGKTSTIKATFNAAATGVFTKNVTVNFSDPSLKKVLTFKGTVK